MIIGPSLLVYFIRDAVQSVQGIVSDAALEASAGLLAYGSQHPHLFHQLLRAVMDVGEAIDLFAAEVRRGRDQVLELGVVSHVVGHGSSVDVGTESGIVHQVLDPFPSKVHRQL